jgi:hypothetical protein
LAELKSKNNIKRWNVKMLNLKGMVVLSDSRNGKYWIVDKLEAVDLEKESIRYSIADINLDQWIYESTEEEETGYLKHIYKDEDGFDGIVIERLWTSGEQMLSNIWLED